jgi:hypothetical protein
MITIKPVVKPSTKRARKPVWSVQGGAVRQFPTMSQAARAFGIEPCTFINLRAAAHSEGKNCFYAAGVKFRLEAPIEEKPVLEPSAPRTAGGPLLVGHCTHRLGVYQGGEW